MASGKEDASRYSERTTHYSTATPEERMLQSGELPRSFASLRRRPDRSHRPMSAGPCVLSNQSQDSAVNALASQLVLVSPRNNADIDTAPASLMPPKQQRAASAAPTRPTTNSNPRNLLRPKSSTAQRKLTSTSADPERVPSSSIHLAGPLHRTATNNNQHASPGILPGSSLKVPPSSAPPFHPSNEVVLPRASGPPPSRPQSAAATKLLSKRSNRPQTAAASASKRVKSAKTSREPSAEPQENDVADLHVSTVEKALDVHLGGGNGKPSSPLKAKHWSPPKHFVTLRQTPMKSPSKSSQLTTPTTSSRPPTSSDSLQPVRDSIEAWMSRKQTELADDSDKSNLHVTFQYAVPAHHFDRSAPYDPYTITYVPFHTVYNAHDGGVRGLQFTDDDRLIDQQIACDFYVMSPKNVLFYNKDHATVTLQSLKEWERERRIFQTLKTLPLFSTYRRTKAMKCWVSHHILRKRQRCKDLLNDLVYFCNPIFYATMDAIQDKIMGLHTQLLFYVDRATVISPHEFQRRQELHIQRLGLEFFALCDAIRQVLVDMSHKYLSHYSSTDAVIKYADVSLTSRKSTTFHMDQFFGTIQKKASPFSPLAPCSEDPTVAGELDLVAIRAELQRSRVRAKSRESIKEKPTMDAIKWSVAAVKRARCSELSRFIRRVDYMLLDAFHGVINRSAAVLGELLESGAGKSSSLLLSKDAYMRAYHRFDIYGNGSLDGAQITRLLHHVFDGKLTDTALDDRVGLFISVFDENGDGDVSIEEFSKGLDVVLDVERMEQFDVSANSIYETTRLAHTNLFIPVPLFEVNVVFDGAHGLSFDPPLKSVQSAIEMTLRGFFDANEHVQRLIQDPTIVPVLTFYDQVRTCQLEAVPPQKSGGGGGPPSDAPISLILFERASQDQAYMHLCEQIFDIVKGSICGCQAYANCFLPLCDEFDWNNGLDFDEIAQKHMDGTYDIERLTQDVKTFHHQKLMLEDLVVSQDIQLIRVKTLALKTALLPSPVRCLKELERILPILAEKNIAKLLTYIELVASKIQRPPAKDLEAFVTYILNLKEINDELPSKDLEAAQITDYLGLITDSGFHIPSQTQAIYDLVEPELSTLKSAVTNCMARRDMDIREYAVLLEQKIQNLEANIAYLQTESCAEQLFEADTEALNALAFTGNLKQLATDYTVRADRFVFVRSLFNEFLPACMPDVPSNGNAIGYFGSLPKLTANIDLKHSMWTLIMEADQSISSWGDIDLRHMPQEAMHDLLDRVTALHGVLGVELPTSPVTARVFELKELLSHTTSIVQNLCNAHVEERHWQKLENKLCVAFQYEVEPATNAASSDDQRCLVRQVDVSFKYLMSLNIHDKHADINEIVQEAVTEAAISKSLHDAIRVWETKEIAFSYWTDSDTRDIVVLGDTSECINMLEESDMLLQTIMGSSYIRHVQPLATKWKHEVNDMMEIMGRLDECKNYWEHMEVFLSPEFLRALPGQVRAYTELDRAWKVLLDKLSKNPSLVRTARTQGLKEQIIQLSQGFEGIYKTLEGYLEIKRQSYPRFCTLSDSELTDLISACRNPHNIQQYLPSCFPSLGVVSFDNDDKSMGIVAVRSPPRPFEEVISMGKNLKARGYVEQWLSHMDRRLSERLQKMIKDLVAYFTANVTQRTWDLNYLREFPLQCIVVANDITTTANFGHKVAQMEVSTTTSVRIKQLTASLTSGDRLLHPCLVSTLLLQQFYYRDTLQHLSEIPWANHPHYVTTDDEVHLAVGDLALPYGYAYHNPTESYLVVTPVTERYLLAIFNCVKHYQAGVVSGGACSGKTSLLQLATIMLGRDLIQTFCTSITSLKQIHRFITGGIGSGGTLLLRNADLLVGPILSFINIVVSTIMNSALTTKHAITLDDREHVIDAGSMIMLTTSSLSSCPVSPNHFRALCESLSSISVMCPAMEQILHAVFFCYGFDLALTLARMLSLVWNEMRGVALRLAPEKNHARFFTIHTAKHCAKLMLGRHMSDEIQLLKDTLQVYLTTGLHLLPDIRTYAMSYIKSLWLVKDYTSVSTHTDDGSGTTINQSDFQTMLKGTYTRHYFVPSEASLHVASALMQAVASHRSIILCGPLKTGKTTCVNMLAAALNDLFVDVDGANPTLPQFPDPPPQDSRFIVIKTLLPMSLSMAQLYGGSIDGNTDTSLIKSVVTENVPCPLPHSAEGFKTNATDTVPRDVAPLLTHRQRVWLVLDGSMEAAWTEHILSLASPSPSSSVTSGLSQFSLLESEDTFTLPSNVTVLFETVDLDHASPTLVLNCSLIHASPFHQPVNDANTSSVRPLQQPLHKLYLIGAIARVRAQIAVPPLVCDLLTKYLVDSTLMDRLLEVLSEGTLHAHLSPLHTAQNVMTLVQSMLSIQPGVDYSLWTKALDVDPASSLNEPRHVLTRQIELAILWSIGWGVGSSASSQTKRLVASVLQREFEHLQDTWANCGGGDMGLYSWVLHLATVTFRPCKDVLCPPSGTRDLSPFSIYIPRVESTLVQLVSKQVLRSGVPLLVFGPADSGSTSCVVDFLQRSSAFAAQGLTTQDRSNIVVTPDKAEAVRISTHRLTTTLIISSLASKLKTKRNECRSSARSSSCVVGKPGPPTRPPDVDAAASVCFETGSFVSTRIQCTPATTIDAVSATVERVMHRERKHVYEPPPGKAMVLFFDDLHLPDHNDFPSPHAWVRSLIDLAVVYNQTDTKGRAIERTLVVATSNDQVMGEWHQSPATCQARLLSRFFPLRLAGLEADDVSQILSPIVLGHFERTDLPSRYVQPVRHQIGYLLAVTIDMFLKFRTLDAPLASAFCMAKLMTMLEFLTAAPPLTLPDLSVLLRLWYHETQRTFVDTAIAIDRGDVVQQAVDVAYASLCDHIKEKPTYSTSRWIFFPHGYNEKTNFRQRQDSLDSALVLLSPEDRAASIGLYRRRIVAATAPPSLERVSSMADMKQLNSPQSKVVGLQQRQNTFAKPLAPMLQRKESANGNLHQRKQSGKFDQDALGNRWVSSRGGLASGEAGGWNRHVYGELVIEGNNLHTALQTQMTRFSTKDTMVLSLPMVEPIVQLCRILGKPGGKAMLVGPPGHAKHSVVKLAAKLMDQQQVHFEASVHPSASKAKWVAALKEVVAIAGVLQTDVTFIVQSAHRLPDTSLEQLGFLLNGREIPLLFTADEQVELADRVKDEKLFELNALHAKEMENLRFELSVAKRAELLAKHDLVRRQIADSREVHSKTAKERELEAMMDLEKQLNAQGQEKIDALMSVQHSAMDDFLRKVEANADIHMSVTMAAVKPSGVVSGIWNEVVQAAARNLRVVVCCEAADVSDFVRRGPKMFAQCQVCLVPALEFGTLKPVIHGRIEAQWKVFQEQETLLESTVVLNLFELIQSQLDHVSTLAAKLHLAASRVMLANGAKDAAVISLHHIPLYARNIFDSIKRLRLRMNQLMTRSRSFLDVYQTAVDQVDSAQTQHQLKQLQIQSTMLQIGEYKLHFEKMQAEAEVIRTLMRKQKADVDEQVKITTEMDKLTKHELKDALKVLDEANKCVANLDRRYIMEIKTFVNPPVLVHVVLNAMCVLFSVEPSWDNAKKLLSDVNFITSMLNYEKDNVPEAILIKLEPYLTNEMFNKTEVEKQSIAASTMVVWIIAIDAYSRSRKLVKPKLDILDAAQAKLRALVAEFSECKKKVDQADKVSSDIEETIQARMEDKKLLEAECQLLASFLVQGHAVLKILGPEQLVLTKHLHSMVEYEATLLGEAVVSAALLTYAGVFSRGLRAQLFDAWAVELASQPLHIHPTHSILNGYAGQPFGLWLKVAGLFHSRHSQQTAYLLAHALPVVLITSFSPHMDSMLRNVLHAVGCNSVVTKSAQDKDVRSVLESCILMGQQLVVHDVTPLLYKSIFHDLVEWDTEWVDGVEHLIYVGHTLTLKRGFRLVLTATAPLAEFGSDVFHVVTVDAAVCWDDMQNVLLDDMELANVGNVDKTGGGGAYDCAKTIMDMEVDLDRSFDALLVHLRNMIREAKYDAALVDSLATMCHQNAQHRSTLDDRRQELDRTMAIRSDTSFAAVTQLGQQVYAALQRLSTLVPDLILALEPYGFRILFIQSLESCGTDVRTKAAGAKCSTPGDVLHKLLEVIAFTIPHEHWQSFLLLLAFEVRAESLQDAENPSELPCPDFVPCGDDDLASIPLKALQRRALVPSRWNAIFTDEAITAMSTTSTDQLFQAFEACTRDVMVIKRTRQVSMATTQPSQSSQIVPSWHDDLPSLVRMPAPYLCLGLLLQCPTKTFDSFCEQLALHTLGLEPKEAVAHRRWGPKDWYKMLINTPDAWYWCVASNAGFTTLSLLHAIMSTIVPREVWPDVLKLLLQRPTVHALSFQVPPDSGSILGHFDSVPSMVQFEGFNPSAFETLQWFVLDMTTSEKWDAVVQYNKKFRLDYRPVGLVPHLKPTLGKPMHQRHAADDDMHSSRMLHIVPTSKARPFTLANVPLAVQPNRLVLHPLGSNPFATEFRRTLLRLVSIPFSSAIGDALELVSADPAVRNVVAIVLWRLFCGLVFFHAALVARQDMVVGRAVDVATVDGSDLVLGVYVITGPLLQTIVQAFVHTTDDTDPLDQLHWPAIHDLFMQHAHGRKCITLRGLHLVRALLRDCVGSYLLIPNSPPQQSKFQLPLPAFQDMLKTPTQSTDEYLTVMCAFASSCKWTVVDVVVPAPVLSIDLRHLVMLPHYRNIPPLHLKQYLVAIATHCLQSLPSALSLKLHPRNALVQHPLRQFLKTVIHAFHRRRDGVEAALQRLVLDITQYPPMTLAGFVAISTNNINDGSNSLARDCWALVMDQLPARLATHTPPLDMSLSAAVKHWQLTASFLTKWWDEAHTEYWCPAILDMTDLMAAFGFTHKMETNTVANVCPLAFIGHVYAMDTPLGAYRNRNNTILLTGLELLNAAPSSTSPGRIREAPGEAMPVQVLLKVSLDNSVNPASNDTMECPMLQSRRSSTPVGTVPLEITPSIHEWATCPYLVLTPDVASL